MLPVSLNSLFVIALRFSLTFICLVRVRVLVCNATFNNMSFISWESFSLMEETGVPGDNHRPTASH